MAALARDVERLKGVHPTLAKKVLTLLQQFPMFVVMGVRTVAEQQALFAQGRTKPGRIVTMKDGVVHKSNHQPHADGLGYAVDCAFTPTPQLVDPFDERHPWESYGLAAERLGLTWGGRWSHPHDAPHVELPSR